MLSPFSILFSMVFSSKRILSLSVPLKKYFGLTKQQELFADPFKMTQPRFLSFRKKLSTEDDDNSIRQLDTLYTNRIYADFKRESMMILLSLARMFSVRQIKNEISFVLRLKSKCWLLKQMFTRAFTYGTDLSPAAVLILSDEVSFRLVILQR